MGASHLQTRTLTDALDRVDTILAARGTRLAEREERHRLARCFSPQPIAGFDSWAFSASEYEETALVIGKRAPELLDRLKKPLNDRDFTVVGHCKLDLRFDTDPNGAESVPHTLRDGTLVNAARITSAKALLYANGLTGLPTVDGRVVYLFQPFEPPAANAAQIATSSFTNRGKCTRKGLTVTFPQARTASLPDYGWVTQLTSEDRLYVVKNFVNNGEAILNENGFFARETQVVQMHYLCVPEVGYQVIIDGPFVVFFADDAGVHVAAWYDRDSFEQSANGRRVAYSGKQRTALRAAADATR